MNANMVVTQSVSESRMMLRRREVVFFSVLLPVAWGHEGPRRVQALALWGIGFALFTVGLPAAIAHHPEALAPAAAAAVLVAILPAASAVAAPRIRLGR